MNFTIACCKIIDYIIKNGYIKKIIKILNNIKRYTEKSTFKSISNCCSIPTINIFHIFYRFSFC